MPTAERQRQRIYRNILIIIPIIPCRNT